VIRLLSWNFHSDTFSWWGDWVPQWPG